MAKGRLTALWDPASMIIATLANIHRDPEQHPEPFLPLEFNPYRQARESESEPESSTGFWQRIGHIRALGHHGLRQDTALESLMQGIRQNAAVNSDS